MRHAVFAIGVLAVLACAGDAAGALVLAQEEGGGIGGSLVPPETGPMPARPRPGRAAAPRAPAPHAAVDTGAGRRSATYSFPINTAPDGWAALKAEPWGNARRLAKVYDGTLFLVVGAAPGWKLVQLESGERGWIVERLVGCCRPAAR